MPTRKSINVSENYAAPRILITCSCMYFIFKKLKGRTKSYFTFFLKLNDHPTRTVF